MTPSNSERTFFNSIVQSAVKEELSKYGEKPIFLTDNDRRRIERAIGVNVSTSEELVSRIERAMSVSIEGIEVKLTPYLLDRLKSRCFGMSFDKFIPMIIKRALEEYAGLR